MAGGVQPGNSGMERPHGFAPSSYHSKSPILKLEVGGKAFMLTKATIDRFPDSLLADLVKESPEILGSDKPLFLDRSSRGFDVIRDIYRTGGFDSVRLPADYEIRHLSEDLDFYKLPDWQKLIKCMDAKALELVSRSSLNAAINDMLKFLLKGDPQNIVEMVKFYMYWEGPQKKLFASLSACIIPFRSNITYERAHLSRGAWKEIGNILRSRGFQLESIADTKSDKEWVNISPDRVKLRATYGSMDISIV